MVIQCTQCDTRFRIADEKLKPGGIKVRCSKCRHIFTVMPPEPEKPTPVEEEIDFDAFNMEPVPEEPAAPKVADQAPAEREQPEAAHSAETATASEPTEKEASEFDFEEEPPSQGPVEFDFDKEPPSTQGPAEFDFEKEAPLTQGPMEFDFEEEPPSQGPEEFDFEEEPSMGQGPVEFDFEEESSGEEGPSEFDTEEQPSLDKGPAEFGFEDEDTAASSGFSFDEADPFSAVEAEERDETEKGAGAPEDFVFGGDTGESAEMDDFDLSSMNFGDEEPAVSREEDVSSIPMEQATGVGEYAEVPAQPKKNREAAAPPVMPRRKSPIKGLLVFVLVLLLALCGVAGYFFWQRGDLNIVKIVEQLTGQGNPTTATGQIRLNELSSSFVTNREAGQLFVIEGNATNDYSETRSAIAVKGVLYNKKGQSLLQQTVFCGNPLSVEALRNMPFAKIEESMNNQFGDSLSNLNVGPGKSIPFTIVFKNLPPDLAEYTVETVDSKPGSKP